MSKPVLSDVTVGIESGARIGIVGTNAAGKSTLLRLLAKVQEPDAGRVVHTRGVTFGFLGQQDSLNDTDTVAKSVVGDVEEYVWASDANTRSVIEGLLFDIPWDALVGTLSGGQRRRVDLARVLCGTWDVLALDEPTNHLDIRTITWLAAHLKNRFKPGVGALLVVTHDRWFLDEVANLMWEVHDGKVESFEGGFSAYTMQRVERARLATQAEQKRQNLLRRELAWLSRGARARATKPKFHVAAAAALIADVPELRNELELKRMAMARLGKQVIEMKNVSVAYDAQSKAPVLRHIDWTIGPGDRIGIVGQNGAGKTTLLKVMQGLIEPSEGNVKIGKTVRFAYLSQGLENLNEVENDPVRVVAGRYTRRTLLDGKEQTPNQILESLGFTGADLQESVCKLSGGQRRRLALMMILLDEPNVLILDEPGNDLDIDMLAAVETLLDGWPGTLIMVTHDRYLMERVTDNQYALINAELRHVPRGIDEYLELMGAGARTTAFVKPITSTPQNAKEASCLDSVESHTKLSGGETRRLRKLADSNERKIETLHGKIDAAQQDMNAADPTDYLKLQEYQTIIDDLKHQVEVLETEWLDALVLLDEN